MLAAMRTTALAAKAMRRTVPAAQRRSMSGHGTPEEIFQHKEMWFRTTVLSSAVIVVPFLAFVLYKELVHEHHHNKDYPHMHIRRKAFPWAESECALFDMHCKHEWHSAHKH